VYRAYAHGVNAFLADHKGRPPPEFLILGDDPEPWIPADSPVWGKLISLRLSGNDTLEAARGQLARNAPPAMARLLFPGAPAGAPITTVPVAGMKHAAAPGARERLGAVIGVDRSASNEWLIAGARTTTGEPILANDPHLGVEAPILWYLARIVTPGLSVKGATAPIVPGVLLGQTDSIAWGFTTADTDTQDLFVETVDPDGPTCNLAPGGPTPFEARDEVIRVKRAADIRLTVRATRHGPVLSDVDPMVAGLAGPGKVMALAFSGLGDRDTTPEALTRLDAARDWDEFLDGRSGNIFSRHYGGFVAPWSAVEAIALTGSEDGLRRAGAAPLTLSAPSRRR